MPKFSRILLKLSGEIFRRGGNAFASEGLRPIAEAIAGVREAGVQVGVVVGGGNIFRGRDVPPGLPRADADQVGMLATVMNVAMLRAHLEALGVTCRVMTPRAMIPVADVFRRREALAALNRGDVVLLGGGTGNPFFSTDSAAALRAIELDADALLKGTMVDGIYDKDPKLHKDAKRYERVSYDEVLQRRLGVMDQTAIALCRDQSMKVVVFDMTDPGNLGRVVDGSLAGSTMERGDEPES